MLVAISLFALATPTADADVERYFWLLESVQFDKVVLPITKCAHTKIREYKLPAAEVANVAKVAELLDGSLKACGSGTARKKIASSLRTKHPGISSTEVEKVGEYAFAIPAVVLFGEAMKHLNVSVPEPVTQPVEIPLPCPADLKAKKGHPCFEKPKQ